MNKKRFFASFAAFIATTIYALNHIIAKDVMFVISPILLATLRIGGATLMFWLSSIFVRQQRFSVSDFKLLLPCAFLAIVNMVFFLEGLSLTTPINSSLIITTTPIIAVFLSVIVLKEKITILKSLGVLIAMLGAVMLILFGGHIERSAPNIPLGNIFILINSTFFAVYLIVIKPLLKKYHLFILMRWMFLIGFLMILPFGWSEIIETPWHTISNNVISGILYVIIGTTFLTFTLNMLALKHLKASTLSVFTYVQPLMAIVASSFLGVDKMTGELYIAGCLVFLGVGMVIYRKNKTMTA